MKSEDKITNFYHFYPKIASVVVVKSKDRLNAMAVAWNVGISSSPPLFGILIAPKRYTHELIIEAKEFSVNFLPIEKADIVAACGRTSGKKVNKFEKFKIETIQSSKIISPILKDAYAAYECKLYSHSNLGDHTLFVGEIIKVHYDENAFKEDGLKKIDIAKPTLYLGRDWYLNIEKFSTKHILVTSDQ